MTRTGGRNERFEEIAAILARGWLRLLGNPSAADAGVPAQKRSISLAISLDQSEVSNPTTRLTERGSYV